MKFRTYIILFLILVLTGSVLSAQTAAPAKTKGTESAKIVASPLSGYIWDTSEVDKINIYTEEDPTNVVFTFDDFQLWATVKDGSGNALGEFYLPDGDVITLSGTGDFIIEVYSKGGSGNWECVALNDVDYELLYEFDWDELTDLLGDLIIAEPLSGSLADKYELDRIDVDTMADPTYVVFDWDSNLDLYAKIYGESEELLATYELSQGNVVTLIGSGIFTIHVYTTSGSGEWSCEALSETDYNSKYEENDVSYKDEKDFVRKFINDMIDDSEEKMMNYISPDYIRDNYITLSDYEVNAYYPVDFIIDSYNADTGIVKAKIWGEDKGWIHGLDFKVVIENDKFYLYPGSHSDAYIDPWYKVNAYLE